MTLILSFVSRDYLIQVSDRRLTKANGEVVDEQVSKTTLFGGTSLFGFTGLARIGTTPTHRFLTDALARSVYAPEAKANRMKWVAHEFHKAVGPLKVPSALQWAKGLTIVGVSGTPPRGDSPGRPALVQITNRQAGTPVHVPADERFHYSIQMLPANQSHRWVEAGVPLTRDERRNLDRSINRVVARGLGAEPICRLFVRQIRAVAARTALVGRALLVSSIPTGRIPVELFVGVGRPNFREPTFIYLPSDGEDGTIYAPNYVSLLGPVTDVQVSFGLRDEPNTKK